MVNLSPINYTHSAKLYPQKGERIVTIASVTSFHLMCSAMRAVCVYLLVYLSAGSLAYLRILLFKLTTVSLNVTSQKGILHPNLKHFQEDVPGPRRRGTLLHSRISITYVLMYSPTDQTLCCLMEFVYFIPEYCN